MSFIDGEEASLPVYHCWGCGKGGNEVYLFPYEVDDDAIYLCDDCEKLYAFADSDFTRLI